ncbi:MAG: AAA family ATPase, partial [Gammaproteobacteria bacterium]|nr:AAA family ATPase [Gammaproteobacteria bacterium]
IEKAHPDVFNILLQVLDDGRLTDGKGRTVDFRNCVIVMTSNLGSQQIQEISSRSTGSDDHYDEMKKIVMETVSEHFRPEFINRIDEVVVFHPLAKEEIRSIANIQFQYLHDRLAERQIDIELTESALDQLGEAGFDPVYGARPLKRAIQQQIENPLAQDILSGKFVAGDVIHVGAGSDGLTFTKLQKKSSVA